MCGRGWALRPVTTIGANQGNAMLIHFNDLCPLWPHERGPIQMKKGTSLDGIRPLPRLTRGALSSSEVIASSLANVAPAMSFMFSFAVIAQGAGAASGLTIGIVAIAILFHANSIAQFSLKMPSSGSYITYIGKTFGPISGVVTSVIAAFGYIASTAGLMAILGGWTAIILTRFAGVHIPWQLITVVLVTWLGFLMIRGVKISTRWLVGGFAFEMSAITLIGVLTLVQHRGPLTFAAFNPADLKGGLAGIGLGFPIAIWMFTGVGNSMGLAEDTTHPRTLIPRSIYISLGFASVVYLGLAWITTLALHNNAALIARQSVPLITAGALVLGPLLIVAYLAGFTSTFAEIIGATNGQARMLFSAARDGLLPRPMSHVNERHAPVTALIVYLGIGLAATLIWGFFTPPITLFGYLGSLAGIPIALIYMAVNLALPVYYRRHHRSEFRWTTHALWPILGTLVMIPPLVGMAAPNQKPPFAYFPLVVAAVGVAGLMYGWNLVKRRPGLANQMGQILADDVEHPGEMPDNEPARGRRSG